MDRSRKTGYEINDNLVNRLIKSTLQTGMITTVIALIDLLTGFLLLSPPSPSDNRSDIKTTSLA
ncbi:hypothetical protein HWV62_2677 [Athelia sp. TMB]|nr:hypothetical protein HWV62_2677 [Athelia sp. TMB]